MNRKMIFIALVGFMFIAFLFALPSMCIAQEGEWTTKADMPTKRSWFSTSEVNGKIYAIGGWSRAGNNPVLLSAVEEYDPATNTWTKKADMPTSRAWHSTSVVNGKIYAIAGSLGGGEASNAVEEYDPVTNTWTKKADIPTGGVYLATSAVNGKIYAIGGRRQSSTVEEYDPVTDTWVRKADMPTARAGLSTSVVNGKIYAIGGWRYEWATNEANSFFAVEEYDPATDTWTEKADMPLAVYDHAAGVVDGKVYVLGGVGAPSEAPVTVGTETPIFLSTMMKYDPATDTWTEEGNMRVPRTALSASVVSGRIYVVGGHEVRVEPLSTVEAYQAIPWGFAHSPFPGDGYLHPDTWVSLAWSAGDFVASHSVYLSDNLDAVNHGFADAYRGNQASTSLIAGFAGFPYPDGLVRGKTYYWRVDEVNETEPNSPWKGPVWSFTVQPERAYNPLPADGAESVDLNVELSWSAGLDAALHTVYFGEDFDAVNNATGGMRHADTDYVPGPLEFAKTYYWRVDEFGAGRGSETHKGEVWSFTTQGAAKSPDPLNSETSMEMNAILSWTPAENAASHEIYFGTDKEAVRNADTGSPQYKGAQSLGADSFDPGILSWDTTYYWRVDEVNNTHPDSPWPGSVWSFTTGDHFVIDDFEDYSIDNQMWWTWKDGVGYANHPTEPHYSGNGTGSRIGNERNDSTADEVYARRGKQSMPYWYDNNKTDSLQYSEAEITLASPQDWTENGVSVLSISFSVDWEKYVSTTAPNDPEPMYVVLNDSAVVYHDDPDVTTTKTYGWKEWHIDLQAFTDQGVDLANVDTIGLGFGDRNNPQPGGQGLMFFDDVRLYR